MAFCDDLKASREALGLSVLEASKKVGIAYNTFRRYEEGKTVPSLKRQEELILALEVTESDSSITGLLNDLAQKQIEGMKKAADENRLLLPLLRKMGWEIQQIEDGRYALVQNGATYNDCKLWAITLSYDELLDLFELLKLQMSCQIIERTTSKLDID